LKNIVFLVVLAAAGIVGYRWFQDYQVQAKQETASARVEAMLRAHASGDEQSAICQWAEGKPVLPMEVIGGATDPYADFARSARLHKGMTWAVAEVTVSSAGGAEVAITIDGNGLRLSVHPDRRIAFED